MDYGDINENFYTDLEQLVEKYFHLGIIKDDCLQSLRYITELVELNDYTSKEK